MVVANVLGLLVSFGLCLAHYIEESDWAHGRVVLDQVADRVFRRRLHRACLRPRRTLAIVLDPNGLSKGEPTTRATDSHTVKLRLNDRGKRGELHTIS